MIAYTAAIVGAGSQGRAHIQGYQALGDVAVAGVADIDGATAEATAAALKVPRWYEDYKQMLQSERPDLVSVCTPPGSHAEVVRYAVHNGVKAVHCEKPVGTTFGEAQEMHNLAQEAHVQLTFNLQRRFDPVHQHAKEQLAGKAVGDVLTIEGYCPNLPDWGSHICDLVLFYLDEGAPSWVMGQVDVQTHHYVYGALAETTSLTLAQWPSGRRALIVTGREPYLSEPPGLVHNGIVVHGTDGRLVASGDGCTVHNFVTGEHMFPSPFNRDPSTWERGLDPAVLAGTAAAIADMVESLEDGREPLLASRHALAGAEIIFATYESSRSRCRVELPLQITDNPLVDGLGKGYWSPTGELRSTY